MRFEPDSLPRGVDDPEPVCPRCGGLLRRAVHPGGEVTWVCAVDGEIAPEWLDPILEEDEQ